MGRSLMILEKLHTEADFQELSDLIFDRSPKDKRPDLYVQFLHVIGKLPYYAGTGTEKIRKNGVLALSAFFQYEKEPGEELIDTKTWSKANELWIYDRFRLNEDTCLVFKTHREEQSAHIHALFVPLRPDGVISCYHFYKGPKEFNLLLNDYYRKMKERFGLKKYAAGQVRAIRMGGVCKQAKEAVGFLPSQPGEGAEEQYVEREAYNKAVERYKKAEEESFLLKEELIKRKKELEHLTEGIPGYKTLLEKYNHDPEKLEHRLNRTILFEYGVTALKLKQGEKGLETGNFSPKGKKRVEELSYEEVSDFLRYLMLLGKEAVEKEQKSALSVSSGISAQQKA